jgi:hypothetical protein
MNTRSSRSGNPLHEFYVFDDKNNKIGVRHSLINGNITIQMKEDSKIIIFPLGDTPEYQSYEGKLGGRR